MDAQQIILDSLQENKTGKMEIHVLKDRCVKKDNMMEYEFRYWIANMLASGKLGLTPSRKIYVLDDERDIL